MPRYLYTETLSIEEPLEEVITKLSMLVAPVLVKTINLVLPAFRSSLSSIRASWRALKASCKFLVASWDESATQYKTVSSAYRWVC